MITPADHLVALERRDHTCAPILKKRTCFVWKGNYFELDEYTTWTPEGGGHLTVLEVELEDLDAQIELPPFVKIEREVTGESAFSNREIARSLMGYGWGDDAKFVGKISPNIDTLWDRVREEGEVSIALPNHQEADRLADKLHGLTEAIACTGRASKTLGLPYVLTVKHTPIHD
jgi:hypothetical protein